MGKGSFSFKGRGRVSSVGSESKGISYMELEEGDGFSLTPLLMRGDRLIVREPVK